MTTYFVTAGQTSNGLTLHNGDILYVSSGGAASDTTVSSGGTERIYSNGTANFTTVSNGGSLFITGGVVSDITLSSGGFDEVFSGGSTISTTVDSGGYDAVEGGTVSFATVNSGGVENANSSGTTFDTTVSGGGAEGLGAFGGISISTLLVGGGIESIEGSENWSYDTVVSSGSAEFVYSGGSASGTTVSSGRYLVVLPIGIKNGPPLPGGEIVSTILSGGEIVSNGVVLYHSNSGVSVYDDVVSGIVVSAGAGEYILSRGSAISTTVSRGGSDAVFSGGIASFTTLDGSVEAVYSGGETIGTTVRSDGIESVFPGGTADYTIISSGGYEQESGNAASVTVSNGGLVEIGDLTPSLVTASFITVSNGGSAVVESGTASDITVSNGGYEDVGAEGIVISTTVDSGGVQTVSQLGSEYDTTVSLGGMIDVAYIPFVSGAIGVVDPFGDLYIDDLDHMYNTQQLAGNYAGEQFQASEDSTGDTLLTLEPVSCFRSGTRILSDRGEVAVEDLRIGDRVQTVLNETAAPIIWIGRRDVDCSSHPKPRQVWPVRVAAGAFGPGRPHSVLFLSPDHAVHVGEVLIPIRHLINGGTIAQVPVKRVTYYHIELPRHDLLLAEGLAAESYRDTGDRANFSVSGGVMRLFPNLATTGASRFWEANGCAPLAVTGPRLDAARRHVSERAEAMDRVEAAMSARAVP